MQLIEHLERIVREEPVARKILVCPNRGVGRELLRALAVRGVGWAGFEITTPRSFALSITGDDLVARGRSPMDEFEEEALLDEAIDEAVAGDAGWTERLSQGIGFREAMANAIQALRLAGLRASDLGTASLENDRKRQLLRRCLEGYARRLAERGKADGASVFRAALNGLAERLPPDPIYLTAGFRRGGLSGRFLEALLASGGAVLESDPVLGLDPPPGGIPAPAAILPTEAGGNGGSPLPRGGAGGDQTDLFAGDPGPTDGAALDGATGPLGATPLSWLFAPELPSLHQPAGEPQTRLRLFAAASPYEEIREVLRRAVAGAATWDQVEIVATDPVVYGSALDEIATRLDIPVTYAVGLPVERSRPGRAAMAYLEWISADFPESLFRYLLASGDVAPPAKATERPSAGRLARRLRKLRVGWGRERYLEAIAFGLRQTEAAAEADRKDQPELDPEDVDRVQDRDDRARETEELVALERILRPILVATPAVPDRIGLGGEPVAPADLARGLTVFLGFVPARSAVEHEARERLLERLGRIEATLIRQTSFSSALAILRKHLDIRIPSPGAEGPPPWSSTGGHLHFSDLEHGGRTGRAFTFVVGLDAERFPGAGIQDPILLDDDRRRLAPGVLPGTAEILEERRYALAAMLAGLRGRVTFSFSAWEAAAGREMPPAGVVLQAHRLASGRPLASYSDLREALGPIVSPVPGGGRVLDEGDVWLDALREDGLFRRAEELIRASFAGLDQGISARRAPRGDVFTSHLGRIEARPALDPRRNPELSLSATALENLGACPLAYLHQGVLGLRDPDDPKLDPGAWLDPRERGTLLHAVYEESLRRARERGVALGGAGFGPLALEVLDEEIARFRGRVPIPSVEIFEREARALAEDLQVFVHMVDRSPPDWIDLERGFGVYGGTDAPIEMPVAGGVIRTRGYIDRIDRLPDGSLRVVDYKTGKPRDHRAKHGVFYQGRRLQHAVYANAASALHGRPVNVFEYHFPTLRGDERPRAYQAARFADGGRVIGRLLDLVAQGHFVPTDDVSDCWYCDHRPICRIRDDHGETHSPPAEWAARVKAMLAEFQPLDEVRRVEG